MAERIELAAAEACNNAILHASGSAFTVSVAVDDGQVVVTVSDDGEGFVDRPSSMTMPSPLTIGHRGLPLMRALVDEVDVSSNGDGTTVVLVQSVSSDGLATPVAVEG